MALGISIGLLEMRMAIWIVRGLLDVDVWLNGYSEVFQR